MIILGSIDVGEGTRDQNSEERQKVKVEADEVHLHYFVVHKHAFVAASPALESDPQRP
jgi:hypothetical protein